MINRLLFCHGIQGGRVNRTFPGPPGAQGVLLEKEWQKGEK
jgi:hypothetical protein